MRVFLILIIFVFSSLLEINCQQWVTNCSMTLSTSFQPNTLITNEKLINCSEAHISWAYPGYNLTIVFTAPQSKPFEFCLLRPNQIYEDILIYRIVDEKETLVVKSDNKVCMKSNSDVNVLTLKFVAPTPPTYYLVFIDYSLN